MKSTLLYPLTLSTIVAASNSFALSLDDLKEMSLEELSDVKVSIASKTPQKLSDSAASVYLITQEDIRRSGATNLPEVLRMVPGMNVANINGSSYAVSARGFHDLFANKFLVMMDGRALHTPLFAGMYWDSVDIPFHDIERIEVIRGSGTVAWGSNAMNGVINIITRSSFDTTGSTLTTSVGTEEQITSFSHVFDVNDDTSVRAWGKFKAHDSQVYHNGEDSNDAWKQGRIGFRLDSVLNETDTLTVHGSTYQGTSDQDIIILEDIVQFKDTQDLSGTYLMGEWTRTDADQSLKAHIYADHMIRDDMRINQRVNTFDTAVQQTVAHNEQGEFTWEMNYRYVTDASSNPVGPSVFASSLFQLIPASMNYEMFGISLQEAYWLTDDVRLTAGVRFDNSESTGWSAQPSLRALWKVTDDVELWSSLSHSIRSPFRYETSLTVTLPPLIDVASNSDPKNESLNTLELGLRMRPAENLSFNVTAFHNQYKNLISLTELLRIDKVFVPGLPPIPFTYHSLVFSNEIDAVSYGAEMDIRWDVSEDWRLKMSYSWMKVSSDDVSDTLWSAVAFNNLPLHQVYLNSAWNLTDNIELDATFSYIDELQESGVDAYTRFDLRLGWTPRPDLELSLIGRNLFDDQHAEYLTTSSNLGGGVGASEIERSITAQLVYKF